MAFLIGAALGGSLGAVWAEEGSQGVDNIDINHELTNNLNEVLDYLPYALGIGSGLAITFPINIIRGCLDELEIALEASHGSKEAAYEEMKRLTKQVLENPDNFSNLRDNLLTLEELLEGYNQDPSLIELLFRQAEGYYFDPLLLDLDGDGVETTSLSTYFDHDANAFAERTSWVGFDDGLLVRDIKALIA